MSRHRDTPQAGIFALGTASHAYLEFDLHAGADPCELVGRLADLREPRTTLGGVNLVVGLRPELWRELGRSEELALLHWPDADPQLVIDDDYQIAVQVNGKSYNGNMPAWKGTLTNDDMAAVIAYIRSAWGNKAGSVTSAQVASTP